MRFEKMAHETGESMHLIKLIAKPEKTMQELELLYSKLVLTKLRKAVFKPMLLTGQSKDIGIARCASLKYQFVPKGKLVFKEGESFKTHYFFILRGRIGVVKQTDHSLLTQVEKRVSVINATIEETSLLKSRNNLTINRGLRPSIGLVTSKPVSRVLGERASGEPEKRPSFNFNNSKQQFSFNNEPAKMESESFLKATYSFLELKNQEKPNEEQQKSMRVGFFSRLNTLALGNPSSIEGTKLLDVFRKIYVRDQTQLRPEEMQELETKLGKVQYELEIEEFFGVSEADGQGTYFMSAVAVTNSHLLVLEKSSFPFMIVPQSSSKYQRIKAFLQVTMGWEAIYLKHHSISAYTFYSGMRVS